MRGTEKSKKKRTAASPSNQLGFATAPFSFSFFHITINLSQKNLYL